MGLLWQDKFACAAAIFLLVVLLAAIFGPYFFDQEASAINLRTRNVRPFSVEHGWMYFLGGDALGRAIFPRLLVGAQNTIVIAASAVLISMLAGATLGFLAGLRDGWTGTIIMRFADILMSFPSLLLALIVLYVLEPGVKNVILVLAITRIPIYLRTTCAEVLEIRERMFVVAARVMGASPARIVWKHIRPTVT